MVRSGLCNMSKSKQKGTTAETAVVNYLNEYGFDAVRQPLSGSSDKGDIYLPGIPVVIEVKNCARMELSQWVKEAKVEADNAKARIGVVWHKKKGTTDPGAWYVTMTGADFLDYLEHVQTVQNMR